MHLSHGPERHKAKRGDRANDGANEKKAEEDADGDSNDPAPRSRLGDPCDACRHQAEDQRDQRHPQGVQPELAKLAESVRRGDCVRTKAPEQQTDCDSQSKSGEQLKRPRPA
jgi:hypothetical protein